MHYQRLHLQAARKRARLLSLVQLAAIVLLTFTLLPAAAHLFELPNKLALAPHDYLIAQSSYRGWALFGFAVAGAFAASTLHAYLVKASPLALRWSLVVLACLATAQIIFWTFTYPMNVLTDDWTAMPADLDAARRQWEFSHAVASVFDFAALVAMIVSVQASRPCLGSGIVAAVGRDIDVRKARARALNLVEADR
jgi:hypothetical protein